MASNGSILWRGHSRGGLLLDAGGVLSILGGILELTWGVIVLGMVGHIMIGRQLLPVPYIPWTPDLEIWLVHFPTRVAIVGILVMILGAIGIAGGISAISRKSFSLSLAGGIGAIPSAFLGVLVIILVAISKREFRVEAKDNGITNRSRSLTAGGILSIIGGGAEVIGAVTLLSYWRLAWLPGVGVLLFLGFLAIVGGVLALRRKGYKASLAGAICALPTVILGILAIWLISDRESEFE